MKICLKQLPNWQNTIYFVFGRFGLREIIISYL